MPKSPAVKKLETQHETLKKQLQETDNGTTFLQSDLDAARQTALQQTDQSETAYLSQTKVAKSSKSNSSNNNNNNKSSSNVVASQRANHQKAQQVLAERQRAHQVRHLRPSRVVDKKLLRHESKHMQSAIQSAHAAEILQTAQPGLLQPEHDLERTYKLSQQQLKHLLTDKNTARHVYDLQLPKHAPYKLVYDRSGRNALLAGSKGHLAMLNCREITKTVDFYVNEAPIHDACFLHNYTMFALAQSDAVYIYDNNGAEIHKMSRHNHPLALQYLPYHFLLASINRDGILQYQDTSTGELVSHHATKSGASHVLRQNSTNAILHAGHLNGTVTLWSPAQQNYLVKMHCHKGAAVHSIAIDPIHGRTMVTGGADGMLNFWDLRMSYKKMHSLSCRPMGIPTSLDFSQRGLLSVGHGAHVSVYPSSIIESMQKPYMHQLFPKSGPVQSVRFRPFTDICGVGHGRGISSMVIPGAGEPEIDTYEYNTNPFQDKKQRQEEEVRALLDKLSPNMISLDPNQIGGIEANDRYLEAQRLREREEEAGGKDDIKHKKGAGKKRGHSKISTQLKRKEAFRNTENAEKLRESMTDKEDERLEQSTKNESSADDIDEIKANLPTALRRFF